MTVIERREREKKERRNSIIDAAEKIFFSQGFENATMQEISQKAELSKGTLYLYFKNKDELCHAIILRSLCKIREKFEKVLDLECSSLNKILELAEVYINFSQEQPNYFKAIQKFRNERPHTDESAEFYQKCLAENRKIIAIIEQIVNTGKEDGCIKNDVDTGLFAQLIWDNQTGVLPAIKLEADDAQELIRNKNKNTAEVRYLFELFKTALQN